MRELLLATLLPGGFAPTPERTMRAGELDRPRAAPIVRIAAAPAGPARALPRARIAAVLATARAYIGAPYRYGGTSPRAGFDCSGFVQYVFARHGVRLPRTARAMARAGQAVVPRLDALRPGDLLLFRIDGSTIDHVALYLGSGRIIHSSSSSGVRTDHLATARGKWFRSRLVGARRVVRPAPRARARAAGTAETARRAPRP